MYRTIGSCLMLLFTGWVWGQGPAEPPRLLPMEPVAQTGAAVKQVPGLTVEFRAPQQINVGMPLECEIVLRNRGDVPAENVLVQYDVPPGVQVLQTEPMADAAGARVRWLVADVGPNGERRLRLKLQALQEMELDAPVTVSIVTMARSRTQVTRPQLAVKQNVPPNLLAGNGASITIDVMNVGTGPAQRVIVRDHLPVGLHHPQGADVALELGTLAAGEQRTVNLDVQAITPGQYVNQVAVTADGGLAAKDGMEVRVGQAGLLLVQTGPLLRYLNTETVFQLEMTNPGDIPIKQVQLLDALPPEMLFAEASDNGRYDKEAHTVEWRIETLLPGETKRLSLKAVPTAPGEMKNRAIAKAAPKLDAKAESSVNVVGVPALTVELSDDVDPVGVGETTTLSVRVRNQGSSAHTKVHVLALMPEGWSIVGVEGSTSHRIIGRQLIFAPLAQLEAKVEALYKIQVRAEEAGDYKFKVQLQSDQLRLPVSAEESTKVFKD